MCGRFLLYTDEEYNEINDIIKNIDQNFHDLKTGEIYPTNYVPTVYSSNGLKQTSLLKWGFPNYKQNNGVLINARGETLSEKPTFKKLIYKNRCLIPGNGFYEWKKHDQSNQKYLIKPANKKCFFMAGLYNVFKDTTGNMYKGFVIITSEANKEMNYIHDRMPVIFDSNETATNWIDNSIIDFSTINSYIHPYKYQLEIERIENINEQLSFNI